MDPVLSAAIVRYTSEDVKPHPWPDEARAVEGIPAEHHAELLSRIRAIVGEMFMVEVDWKGLGYVDGVKYVTSVIRHAHPELDDSAITSLQWLYSYEMR